MARQKPLPLETPFQLFEKPTHYSFVDLEGRTYGRLVVQGYAGKRGHNQLWACRCSCGTRIYALKSNLSRGNTTSCGCAHSEWAVANKTKHGLYGSKEYAARQGMIARCARPGTNNLHYVRGVKVCDRWLVGDGTKSGIECFYADMGPHPGKGFSLDRIDNDGDYSPQNCRWATHLEQAANTTRTRRVFYQGEEMIMAEAIRRSGFKSRTIYQRMHRGWNVEEALVGYRIK